MKTNLGTHLSRNEMKNVMGGKTAGNLVCTCGDTTNTTVCGFTTLQGGLNCLAAASQYCSTHGGAANCDGSVQL
jgi:hypothetical protein